MKRVSRLRAAHVRSEMRSIHLKRHQAPDTQSANCRLGQAAVHHAVHLAAEARVGLREAPRPPARVGPSAFLNPKSGGGVLPPLFRSG